MTVQHEIVNKLADRIVAESAKAAGRPIVEINGKTTTLTPATGAAVGRIAKAWAEAQKLGVGSAVLAEIRRRGFDTGASVAAE